MTLADDEDESPFVRVHDDDYITGAKRLYMTATPRIYDDATQGQGRRRGRRPGLDGRRERSTGRSSTASGSARLSRRAC